LVDVPRIEAALRQMLVDNAYQVFLAEEEGQVIGLLSLSFRHTLLHPAPSALIDEFVVDREYRGRGVGRELIAHAVARAKAAGCCEIEVSTEKDNVAAQEFYRRQGFDHESVLLEMEFEG
jgi:ribosomal protein S18 acetylase RimI-like enzyme